MDIHGSKEDTDSEAGAEPMLDLAFVGGRPVWISSEKTEEEQNKDKDSEQRRAQKRRRETLSSPIVITCEEDGHTTSLLTPAGC